MNLNCIPASKSYTFCKPFLKWAGGKRLLFNKLLAEFPPEFNNYHEPFLGGGSVFFELYSRGFLHDKIIFLSDINSDLINTYNIVKSQPHELIDELKKYQKKHSKKFYYATRELDRCPNFDKLTSLEQATRFIYLNKTCFNGLCRVNKQGNFNTPIGNYEKPNIVNGEIILSASKALQNTTIANVSFLKTLKKANKNDFIYLDPPYYPMTKTASFTAYNKNNFLEKEQEELFQVYKELDRMGCQVAQSNSETKFIRNLYKEYEVHAVVMANRNINSDFNNRQKIEELIIRNYRND